VWKERQKRAKSDVSCDIGYGYKCNRNRFGADLMYAAIRIGSNKDAH